jgi:hypothetical protein
VWVVFAWFTLAPANKRTALALLGGFVGIFIWWVVYQHFITEVGSVSLLAANMSHGIYPGMMYENRPETFGFPYHYNPQASAISASVGHVIAEILRRFQEDFWTYLGWYTWGKLNMLFSWNIIQGMGDIFIYEVIYSPYQTARHLQVTHALMFYLHTPLVWLAWFGTVMAWLPFMHKLFKQPQIKLLRLCSLLMLYFIAVHLALAPFPRYSVPLRPVIYCMAIFALVFAWRALLHWRNKTL